MSQTAVKRLYLMQVGIMPEYHIPLVCYLVQTDDGKNILIDTGLPEVIPEEEKDMENGQDVIQQLASIGLKPEDIDTVISTHYDIDHAGRHAAFTQAQYIVQRVHHLNAVDGNPRFAPLRSQWDQPIERIRLVDGDTQLLPGLELIETSGHVPGHQSVLVRLPKTGTVLLTIDAVPFAGGFTRDPQNDGNPNGEAGHASTIKLLDLVEQEHIGLVIFGHDVEQWKGLKKLPEYYE